jgi:hypothetical protein
VFAALALVAVLAACASEQIDGGATTRPATTRPVTAPHDTAPHDTAPHDTAPDGTLATATRLTMTPARVVVLRDVTTGGCVVLGPNCPTYAVYADGTVEITRTGTEEPPEITGAVPAQAVLQWLQLAQQTDFVALAATAGPGVCQSCFDGSDSVITITWPGQATPVQLDSTKVHFDESLPFFAALDALLVQVQAVGQLTVRQG